MAQPSPIPLPLRAERDAARSRHASGKVDVYFSADVETDGPIPGPYSMLSLGIVVAGTFDGETFTRPSERQTFYRELRPISDQWEPKALEVNGLDRSSLLKSGADPAIAMTDAVEWIQSQSQGGEPVLVAYPLSFDWTWLYWYFMNFIKFSPFNHSRCFDIKTAYAVKAHVPISGSGRAKLPGHLLPSDPHTHNALNDALEQAEIFARVFEWSGDDEGNRS